MSAPDPQTLEEKTRSAYDRFGVSDQLELQEKMSIEHFLQILVHIEPRIPEIPCRVFPTSFTEEDSLRALPRSLDWRWHSCERALSFLKAQGVFLSCPIFWQLRVPANLACRAAGVPMLLNEPHNLQVAREAIARGLVDTVIADVPEAVALCDFFATHRAALPRAWIIIHSESASAWTLPSALAQRQIAVAQEVHLFPGVPILTQCPMLAQRRETAFHLADEYCWEFGETVSISGAENDPLPFARLILPFLLEPSAPCPCGAIIYTRPAAPTKL